MTLAGEAGRPLSVLVVDDDPDTVTSTVTLLALCGYDARAATSGDEALRATALERPDVVLMDLLMPGLDGYDLARRLRESPADHCPLLVAVTGCEGESDRRRSAAAGIDVFLVKPVAPSALLRLLESVRESRRRRPAAEHTVGCCVRGPARVVA